MKRAEKIALLGRIINGGVSPATRRQLRRSKGDNGGVIVYQCDTSRPGPDDPIHFKYDGQRVTIPHDGISAFSREHPDILIWIPDNGRDRPDPESMTEAE
jgi:hypothetical protein